MKLPESRQAEGTIPTASMADIAFLLIIFFMLTITFEVDKAQVELPKTTIRVEVPKKAAYVSIDASGRVRVSSGDELSVSVGGAEDVFSFATGVLAGEPGKVFVVKADEGVAYREVDAAIDALKRAKVRLIYLLSDQETVDSV
jgi:biopolymer transport protein ExbD